MDFYWWIIIAAAAAVLVALLVVLLKKRRRRREMEQNAEDRLREEALDRVLVGDRRDGKRGTMAFDVKYDQDPRSRKNRGDAVGGQVPVMLQLTEKSELSTRKYMLHAEGRLSIGSQADCNDIVISGSGVEKRQCEIVRIGKQLYASNLGKPGQVLLKRARKQMVLEKDAVELRDNDVLYIGDFTYHVTILRD